MDTAHKNGAHHCHTEVTCRQADNIEQVKAMRTHSVNVTEFSRPPDNSIDCAHHAVASCA